VPKKLYRGNGKLLLFGEYAVLDGAKSLALPTKFGQSLEVKPHRGSDLIWECYDDNNELWFEAQISLYDFSSVRTSDEQVSKFIKKLLKGVVQYNTEFLNNWNGFKVINRLDFNRHWGLGSSSTLIHNVAKWADINPYHLHFRISNGSGYDIACADAESPIIYQLLEDQLSFEEIDFDPGCLDNIYFVYLGKKQNSGEAIIHYSKKVKKRKKVAEDISKITEGVLQCVDLDGFCDLINAHEEILSQELEMTPVKEERFRDFEGSVKSLGAWGGDFCMVATPLNQKEVISYFKAKGLETIFSYKDLIYSNIDAPVVSAVKA